MKTKTIYTMITHEAHKLPFYLTGIGMKENQQHINRPQGYSDYQIAYCTYGEGKFLIDGNIYTINKGTGFFFIPDLPHEYYATSEPWGIKWVNFTGQQVEGLLGLLKIHSFEIFHETRNAHIEDFFDKLYFQVCSNEEASAAKCTSLLFSMLVHLSELIHNKSINKKNDKHKKLQPVIQLMNQRYSSELTLDEMACEINVSRHFLCHLFKEIYHTSPFRYLMQLRIQKAKQILHESKDILIKDIAKQTGFNDSSYFCSTFKEFEGVTPLEFRQRHIGL